MFHLQYPASKYFMTWDELGCLSRAFGFTADLFKNCSYTDDMDIKYDENGIDIKSIFLLLDLNMLCNDLHLTSNMHTGDWNARAISCAVGLLAHRVLDFQGVHDVRMAYMTYEHTDMMGMVLNTLVISRALKLCRRAVAPLKLMHRIKHMKAYFQEPDRIQLDEFFILILWCDLYEAYSENNAETASGKDGDLFKMVDFGRLLSYHDQRLANRLNVRFLQQERDYGTEKLGPKDMFKDRTVNAEPMMEQVHIQKEKYKPLKSEVNQSERRVHKAQAGSVRPRPINVPDLDKYRPAEQFNKPRDLSVQSAHESLQKRVHSAPPTFLRGQLCSDQKQEFVRQQIPRVATPHDLSDVQCKLENLLFDVSTLETRRQVQVENEMMFYIPGYLQKLANKMPDTAETLPPQPKKKQRHWSSQIVKGLVYPRPVWNPTHANSCDARFRGWHKVNSTPGNNFVLTSQPSSISKRGIIPQTRKSSSAAALSLRPEYVIRFNPRTGSSPQGRREAHDSGLETKRLGLPSYVKERTTS